MTATDSKAVLALGTIVSDYSILKVLANEEVGVLYLARRGSGQKVFLRVVADAVSGEPEALGRIEATLKALAEVVHRNVAPVLGGAEEDEFFFYVLDAPGATTLFDLAYSSRSLSERELVWLGRGLTAGVAALHAGGVTHGGLSPNKVLVTRHGPIVVDVDWTSRVHGTELSAGDDFKALRDTLQFAATSRSGKATELSESVRRLLEDLADAEDAASVANAWSEAASELHLPDPMAPDTLTRLLDDYEAAHGADGTASDVQRPLPDAPLDASGEFLVSDSDVHTVLPGGAQPKDEGPVTSEASLSAVSFAKSMLAEFPVDPHSQESIPLSDDTPRPDDGDTPSPDDDDDDDDDDKTETVTVAQPGADALDKDKTAPPPQKKTKKTKRAKVSARKPKPRAGKAAVGGSHSASGKGPPLGGFGAYTLKEEVYAGRAGTVYRASRADTDRPLAVKVLFKDTLDEKALTRFLRGAESAESLQHPAIAKVIDSGVEDGWVYVTSQYIEGRTLADVCREDTAHELLPEVMLSVLEAIGYAHARGVVHGDLKPETIVVTEEGEARILEFGVPRPPAKAGKPAPPTRFTPPEGQDESEAADVYALGLVLYAAASQGKLPDDASLAARMLGGNPAPPSCFDPSVPWQIDAIALHAIQEDPAERYPTVFDMCEDLRRCVKGPLQAPAPAPGRRLGRWAYSQPLPAALLLVVLGLAALLLGTKAPGWARALNAKAPPAVAQGQPPVVPTSPTRTPIAAPGAEGSDGELKRLREAELRLSDALEAQRGVLQDAKREWDQQKVERAKRLVALGDSLLAADQPEEARVAYTEAQDLSPLQAAQDGIAEAELRIARPRTEPEDATRLPNPEPRAEDATRYMQLGKDHLNAGRLRDARGALRKALSLGAIDAGPLLSRVERKLFDEEQRLEQEEQRAADRVAGETLVRQAEQYAARGAYSPAFVAFMKALAKDPSNEAARAGLQRLRRDELEAARQAEAPSGNRPGPQAELANARQALTTGRQLFKQGADPDDVYAAYLYALKALDRATFYDASNDAVQRERILVAQELAAILRDQGQSEFAGVILKANGITASESRSVQIPLDPYLVIEEAERVSIRRAFGGTVRFEPTDSAFRELREWVKAQGERFRLTIQVKSRVQKGFPPTILATGLWIRLEDKISKTNSPPRRIEFADGPHKRLVRVTARGRIVLPFTRLNVLRERYVPEAIEAARELLTSKVEARKAKAKAERLRRARAAKEKSER